MTDELVNLLKSITDAIQNQPEKPEWRNVEAGKISQAEWEDEYDKWATVDDFVKAITNYEE